METSVAAKPGLELNFPVGAHIHIHVANKY